MTKDEALRLAMDWYGSGNQDPDEFERLILSIVAQPEQKPTTKAGELRAMKTELWKQPEQDGECKHCTDGCPACDARKLPEQEPVAFINVEQRKLEWAKYMSWDTPTVVNLPKIPLYTTPPQRTWEPVETAPKDGTDVLLMYMHIDTQVVHNGFWIGASDADDESEIGWWSYDYSEVTRIKLDDWMNPTHWLPLPKLKEKNA